MVVIGRCVFWAKAAADAAAGGGKRSAHRCDELHAVLMAWSVLQPVCCSLLVKMLRGVYCCVCRSAARYGNCLQRSMRAQTTGAQF